MRSQRHLFITVLCAGLAQIAMPAALGDIRYTVQDAPWPQGISETGWGLNLTDVNDRGEVVGWLSGPGTDYNYLGFYWNSATGQVATISQPAGGRSYTRIWAINNQGLMAGETSVDTSHNLVGAAWASPSGAPYLVTDATWTDNSMLGVNNNGQLAGYAHTTTFGKRAVLWTPAQPTYTILPPTEPPVGQYTGANMGFDVNDAGIIVGLGDTASNTQVPVRYDPTSNKWTELSIVSGKTVAIAQHVNNSGVAIGYSTDGWGYSVASLWDQFGVLTDLRTKLPSVLSQAHAMSLAQAINDQGVVLVTGRWQDATSLNWLNGEWLLDTKTGVAQSVNDLLPAAYGGSSPNPYFTSINNNGQIVGSLGGKNVLLTPYQVQTAPVAAGAGVHAAPAGAGLDVTFGNVGVPGTLVAHAGVCAPTAFAAQFLDDPAGLDCLSGCLPGSQVQFWILDLEQGSFDQATVTFTYDPSVLAAGQDESALEILHYHDGAWETLPVVGRDLVNHEITVTTTSFSPFVLGVPEPGSLALLALGGAMLMRLRRRGVAFPCSGPSSFVRLPYGRNGGR